MPKLIEPLVVPMSEKADLLQERIVEGLERSGQVVGERLVLLREFLPKSRKLIANPFLGLFNSAMKQFQLLLYGRQVRRRGRDRSLSPPEKKL